MIRRICIHSGPGVGKSALAADIFSRLKKFGWDIELVPEFIKSLAYEGRQVDNWDQLHIFSQQLRSEKIMLQNVSYIVTDSPILMNTAYSKFHNFNISSYLIELAIQFETEFPSLNIFVDRTVPYVQKGRYHSETQAKDFDLFLQDFLKVHLNAVVHHFKVNELDNIIDLIEGHTDV